MAIEIELEPVLVDGQHRLVAVSASADATPKKTAKPKPQSIGELALKNRDTAEEAAKYINTGSYPQQGYHATHQTPTPVIGPNDWCGKAKDERWLIVHGGQDNKATTPKS